MNFVSPGIEKRMPKATTLHKQLQEAEAVLSRGFTGFDHLSPSPAVHQHCLQCGTPYGNVAVSSANVSQAGYVPIDSCMPSLWSMDKLEEEGEIIWYLRSTNSKGKKAAHESQVLGNLPFSL